MSMKHPIIAVTGSSGAGTTTVMKSFQHVFRREKIKAQIVEGDVAAGFRALDLPLFDRAVSNPPFFDDPGALRAPAEGKRGAWMADDGLKAWTTFLLKSVREGGRIVVIHRADRLADLLALLGETAGSFAVPRVPVWRAARARLPSRRRRTTTARRPAQGSRRRLARHRKRRRRAWLPSRRWARTTTRRGKGLKS
jgi:methylase of polypeptide subunit release factors